MLHPRRLHSSDIYMVLKRDLLFIKTRNWILWLIWAEEQFSVLPLPVGLDSQMPTSFLQHSLSWFQAPFDHIIIYFFHTTLTEQRDTLALSASTCLVWRKPLLVFASRVTLGFGHDQGPWPYFCFMSLSALTTHYLLSGLKRLRALY
jgi:hypothetical protein